MKTKEIIFLELRPDENKMLSNGKIITDYVCIIKDKYNPDEWTEIDIDEDEL